MILYIIKYQGKIIQHKGMALVISNKAQAVRMAQEYCKANNVTGVEVVRLHLTVHSAETVVIVE